MAAISTKIQEGLRDVYYSIGTDETKNIKETIAQVHGVNSEVMKAADELERYVADPETRKSPWYWNFYKKVKSAMSTLYPHADNAARIQMAQEFIDDLSNGGYIRALQSMSVESGAKNVSFAQDYADGYGVSIGAALLFGPKGGAIMELLHFLAAEKTHGLHRNGTSPHPQFSKETRKSWYNAERTSNWPTTINEQSREAPVDVAEENRALPDGATDALRDMWRSNPVLRYYTGTNRLSGDIPYQIIEDVVDVLVQGRFSLLDQAQKAKYNQIIEQANRQGIDPFYAAYQRLFVNKDRWRPIWDKARKFLYDHSLLLWESQNKLWLTEGKLNAGCGVVFRKAKECKIPKLKRNKYGVPGTIYLNNGRYYWIVAGKMNPKPLIEPKSKPKVPGTIFKDGSRYYWIIPGLLKRQRLVPKGEKFSAQDRATAEKVAIRIWKQLKKKDPALAATILERTRSQGLATKDKAVAERIAARLWRRIKRKEPELAARILKDNRPKAKDHWHAQIVVGQKHRFIGSFATRAEAQAAYMAEFEKSWGYPAGYNVKVIPKLDKVWPTWEEQKARLERMDEHPRMPVIGQTEQTESLLPMIQRMQNVNWLGKNVMLVFDDNSPLASEDIVIQSRGISWFEEIKKQGKRPIICGSASMDPDIRRIRITIYNQGFGNKQVLIEEIYHIGIKIIRYLHPEIFEDIQRWYKGRLAKGCDPTFSMADMFCCNMATEECGIKTSLPRLIVKHARKIFCPVCTISNSVMEQVKANWSALTRSDLLST